jgi:hypothetical protein
MTEEELRDAAVANALALVFLVNVRSAAYTWFNTPRPGDLVIEMSAGHTQRVAEWQRLGTLISDEHEFVAWDSEEQTPDNQGYYERVVTIRDLTGCEQRWTNAMFSRVPRNTVEWLEVIRLDIAPFVTPAKELTP